MNNLKCDLSFQNIYLYTLNNLKQYDTLVLESWSCVCLLLKIELKKCVLGSFPGWPKLHAVQAQYESWVFKGELFIVPHMCRGCDIKIIILAPATVLFPFHVKGTEGGWGGERRKGGPMRGLELIMWLRANERPKKNCTWWRRLTDRQVTDMATIWLNRPSGADSMKILHTATLGLLVHLWIRSTNSIQWV